MEMTPLTSVLAAARVERQQLHDEMATLRANYRTKIPELADDFIQEDSKLRVRLHALDGRIAVLLLHLDPESSSQPMELEDGVSSGGPGSGNYLRFFFVCQATHGTYPRCFTMYTSKGWRRKYPTLEYRKGQAYICECNAKYNPNWGCLVEFSVDGVLYYMRAPVPDARTLDMLAGKAEETFYKPGMSAADLFNKLPSVPPQSSTFVRMASDSKDVMKITNPDFLDSLAVFPWSQIMNMAPQ